MLDENSAATTIDNNGSNNNNNNTEAAAVGSPPPPNPGLSGTTDELFHTWLTSCLEAQEGESSLSQEAKHFFQSLSNQTTFLSPQGNIIIRTKSSHPEALASLIQTLGPAFDASIRRFQCRRMALECIRGAVQGCTEGSNDLVALLANFFLSCMVPIQQPENMEKDHEMEDDYEADEDNEDQELFRDAALEGLMAVLEWSIGQQPTQEELIVNIIQWTKRALIRRCSLDEQQHQPISAGLSMLSRARRSTCFRLLEVATRALERIPKELFVTDNVEASVTVLTTFTANCLHGESDPRCLLQLLQLIHLQLVLCRDRQEPIPVDDVFNAVAPYYPIQFTPPPNNPHGITKAGLRQALIQILAFDPEIVALAIDLVVECMVPPPEDGIPTFVELHESLQDMEQLLLQTGRHDHRLQALSLTQLRQLADALYTVHSQASGAVQAGKEIEKATATANLCRSCLTQLSSEAERFDTCWNVLVRDVLLSLVSKMNTKTQGRMAIAHATCFTGGIRTLTYNLEVGLTSLLDHLQIGMGNDMVDEEVLAMVVLGVAAYFSATRVFLEQGISVHPHPLQRYTAIALNTLMKFIDAECSVSAPAVRAMESVLVVSPANQYDNPSLVNRFIQKLVETVLKNNHSVTDESWLRTCTECLGRLLGNSVKRESQQLFTNTILYEGTVQVYFVEEALPALIQSALTSESVSSQQTLAVTCTSSLSSATQVVKPLVQEVLRSLERKDWNSTSLTVYALKKLFDEPSSYASRAFQRSDASFRLLSTLSSNLDEKVNSDESLLVSFESALSLVTGLQGAYQTIAEQDHVEELVTTVSKAMPPLNGSDVILCSLHFALLSVALEKVEKLSSDCSGLLTTMLSDLADFAMTTEYHQFSRSVAAQTFYLIATRFMTHGSTCKIRAIASKNVLERMFHTAQSYVINPDKRNANQCCDEIADHLSIIALMSAAAAELGGPSSDTADKLFLFLVNLSCSAKAKDPFHATGARQFDLSCLDAALEVHAASAIGVILSYECGSRLWKQRLTYTACKVLQEEIHDLSKMSFGVIAAVGVIVCSSSLNTISSAHRDWLTRTLIAALAPQYTVSVSSQGIEFVLPVLKITLAGVVKLVSTVPDAVKDFIYPIITGSMRAYVSPESLNASVENSLPCKLLALQVLHSVTKVMGALHTLKECKAPVVSILEAAMNHPLGILRQAAVDVRNTWFLIE